MINYNNQVYLFQPESSASFGLSLEPNPLPVTSNKNELDINYENMIENLLLQQVLLYTRERTKNIHPLRSPSSTTNSLLVRQQMNTQSDQHSLLNCSTYDNNDNDEPTLCLIESRQQNSSELIENILNQYNQRHDNPSNFDQTLMELIVKRNRERHKISSYANNIFYLRLQWLAIGFVIDRLFFSIYFAATIISYLVTLWFIPFTHPNLKIDIHTL
ncbi:unnamed protein product [Rotaria sp. Silwood1]|nr:unnamed protein product [Rotaria sp. Silwood1]CAF3723890.1 unnamed protein product [Rotaria sp. Silwood1]CAF4782736.1 unnamed protein product [Rotaria sp. Silwood1]